MKQYVIRRLLSAIPLLLIISFVCFVFINLIPSDPAEVALRVRQVPIITDEIVLRCFSSPGSPRTAMYSLHADRGFLCRVSPFRYLRIIGYVLLPEAFRSLSRLSSALSAKASTLRPYYFNRSRNDRIS